MLRAELPGYPPLCLSFAFGTHSLFSSGSSLSLFKQAKRFGELRFVVHEDDAMVYFISLLFGARAVAQVPPRPRPARDGGATDRDGGVTGGDPPLTPLDTPRHLATRRPAATAARQTATEARQTATAARPTRDGGATDRDPARDILATSRDILATRATL